MVTINSRAIKRSLSLFAFVPLIAISRSFLPPFSLFVSHGSLRRSSGLYCLFFKAKNLRRSSLLFCFKKNPPPLVNWAVAPSPSHHGWLFRVNPQSAIKSRFAYRQTFIFSVPLHAAIPTQSASFLLACSRSGVAV